MVRNLYTAALITKIFSNEIFHIYSNFHIIIVATTDYIDTIQQNFSDLRYYSIYLESGGVNRKQNELICKSVDEEGDRERETL